MKTKTSRRRWTKEQCDILFKFYPSMGSEYCSKLLNKTRMSILHKAVKLNLKSDHTEWKQEEINILKRFYTNNGPKYCYKLIKRSQSAIRSMAIKLNLKTMIANSNNLPKKTVIKKISNSQVVSTCNMHGETTHEYRNNKIYGCKKCRIISESKRPIYNFTKRIRCLIRNSFKRIDNKNGVSISRGCFRNLDYTPTQLYNYLTNIKKLQDNKCPICKSSYDKCEMNIEHVIPLEKAKTEQQVIDLFDLKNLNLMCKSCNSSKSSKNYNIWMENRKCH
jgi:hypothetical protein